MNGIHGHVKTCTSCGKMCFTSRKLAKKYLNKHFPNEKMTIYRCRDNQGYFHFGHTPYGVKRGFAERGRVSA